MTIIGSIGKFKLEIVSSMYLISGLFLALQALLVRQISYGLLFQPANIIICVSFFICVKTYYQIFNNGFILCFAFFLFPLKPLEFFKIFYQNFTHRTVI